MAISFIKISLQPRVGTEHLLMIDLILILEDYRWETVPVPTPGPKEVLVKVASIGIYMIDSNGSLLH
jgi:hypothetical protein